MKIEILGWSRQCREIAKLLADRQIESEILRGKVVFEISPQQRDYLLSVIEENDESEVLLDELKRTCDMEE